MGIYYEKKLSFSFVMVATEIQSFNSYSIKHLGSEHTERGRIIIATIFAATKLFCVQTKYEIGWSFICDSDIH